MVAFLIGPTKVEFLFWFSLVYWDDCSFVWFCKAACYLGMLEALLMVCGAKLFTFEM